MHTPPSEDDPGTTPLAVARVGARAGNPLAGGSAEPAADFDSDGANGSNGANASNGANGSNGHQLAPEHGSGPQPERPQLERPQLKRSPLKGPRFTWPRLSGPWLRRAILVAWPVGLAAAGVALYLCYLAISRTQEVTSDGASNALQAWAMLHGNPLLRGWTVTDVSFYTTELPEYMIV